MFACHSSGRRGTSAPRLGCRGASRSLKRTLPIASPRNGVNDLSQDYDQAWLPEGKEGFLSWSGGQKGLQVVSASTGQKGLAVDFLKVDVLLF